MDKKFSFPPRVNIFIRRLPFRDLRWEYFCENLSKFGRQLMHICHLTNKTKCLAKVNIFFSVASTQISPCLYFPMSSELRSSSSDALWPSLRRSIPPLPSPTTPHSLNTPSPPPQHHHNLNPEARAWLCSFRYDYIAFCCCVTSQHTNSVEWDLLRRIGMHRISGNLETWLSDWIFGSGQLPDIWLVVQFCKQNCWTKYIFTLFF